MGSTFLSLSLALPSCMSSAPSFPGFPDSQVPLGLYVRKSLQQSLDSKELFLLTKQGLQFYKQFFDFAYPFAKYDQIFCPEFNQGAMENAGAVTFSESYIFRDPPTQVAYAERAETLLHEMAH